MSREAVIVATARTPIGKAYKGSYRDTPGQELAGHAIATAVARAGLDSAEIEDVILGCAMPEGSTGYNVARQAALRAGLPVDVPGMTLDRQCSSGLMAVASAARQIILDGMTAVVGGGVESISLVQNEHMNTYRIKDPWFETHQPDMYLTMLQTAETVAQRYNITREQQDQFALQSQRRTAAAQQANVFADEIVPLPSAPNLILDEGNRPGTTADGLTELTPVLAGRWPGTGEPTVTAGNASQLSDGAAALVLMERSAAERRDLPVLGAYRGLAVAGCAPDEMGIGPVFAVPKLLKQFGLSIDDIDLWELNEAFASQALYCIERLGLDSDKVNVNGGAISIGHPYGMTGARTTGHILREGLRRQARYCVVTMCIGGGMGAAGLFEIG